MASRTSQFFYLRRGTDQSGPFIARELKEMVTDGRLLPDDFVSREGGDWHRASTVGGLEFRQGNNQQKVIAPPVPVVAEAPPPLPPSKPALPTGNLQDVALPQNPVSVLLNSLVTEKIAGLHKEFESGRLAQSQFESTGRLLLQQLQSAVNYLSRLDTLTSKATESGPIGNLPAANTNAKISDPKNAKPEVRKQRPLPQADPPPIPISNSVSQTSSGFGLGGIASVAGAAVLGGAFGYLLANQSRHSHVGAYGLPHTDLPEYGSAQFVGGGNTAHSDAGAEFEDDSDVIAVDTNGDSVADKFVADTNGDNVADFTATDDDGDGLIDSFETDLDHDGDFDRRFVHDPLSDGPAGIDNNGLADNADFAAIDGELDAESDLDDVDAEWDSAELDSDVGDSELGAVDSDFNSFDSGDFDSGGFDGGDMDFGD
jgi:hypothetical protein